MSDGGLVFLAAPPSDRGWCWRGTRSRARGVQLRDELAVSGYGVDQPRLVDSGDLRRRSRCPVEDLAQVGDGIGILDLAPLQATDQFGPTCA